MRIVRQSARPADVSARSIERAGPAKFFIYKLRENRRMKFFLDLTPYLELITLFT
jgi:DNA primase